MAISSFPMDGALVDQLAAAGNIRCRACLSLMLQPSLVQRRAVQTKLEQSWIMWIEIS